MDQAEKDHIQHEIENEANKLFPGRIRRVELLQHDDAPMIEPGQLMPRLVFADPADRSREASRSPQGVRGGVQAGRRPRAQPVPGRPVGRWPEIRYIEMM